jgi:hypothetical protein
MMHKSILPSCRYHQDMHVTIPVEDNRGVDVARIRELLSMTAQERVQHMLSVVAVMHEMSARGQATQP